MKKVLIGSALTVSLLLTGTGQSFASSNQDEGIGRQSIDINTLRPTYLSNDNDIRLYHPSTALSQMREDLERARLQIDQEQDVSQARELNRAVRLLKEETGLRDLVQMYRNALYQG